MKLNLSSLLRYWAFFRRGNSLYFNYILNFVQFIVIVYAMAIANVPFLRDFFPHLYIFAIVFGIVYSIASILVGYWDYKKGSVITDNVLATRSNPMTWDTVESSILNAEALKDFFHGDIEEAVKKIDKSIEITKRWRKDA